MVITHTALHQASFGSTPCDVGTCVHLCVFVGVDSLLPGEKCYRVGMKTLDCCCDFVIQHSSGWCGRVSSAGYL